MIFRDPAQQQYFDENGFVAGHFLSPEELDTLRQAYRDYAAMGGQPIDFAKGLKYHISVFDSNLQRRAFADKVIKSIFEPKVRDLLPGYRILTCNFMTKSPGDGEIEVHQDFSHVDEKKYTAFNLWCPLQDTDTNNGGLYLIRGSNKLFNSYRSATIPHNLTHYSDTFKKYLEPIPVKAGDGLLFDHRLFHYSSPNTSGQMRLAVQMAVIPSEATPVMYRYEPEQDPEHLQVYELTEDFLLTSNLWEGRDGLNFMGTVPYEKIPDAREIRRKLIDRSGSPFKLIEKILSYV